MGKPNNDDLNLVKNNQASPPPAVPAPPASNPPAPTETPVPKPAQNQPASDIGVGRPNIGVELEDSPKQDAPADPFNTVNAAASPPTADVPPAPPVPAPPSDGAIEVPINKYSNNVSIEKNTPEPPGALPVNSPSDAAPEPISAPSDVTPPPPALAGAVQPPVRAPKNTAAIVGVLTFLALLVGSSGGFFGFKYLDRIKSTASELTSTASPSTTSSTVNKYSSTKYGFSFEYPKAWKINTTDTQATAIIVASDQESLEGTATGYKVSIDFQANDGKTLKAWVDSHAATSGETKTPQEVTVSAASAYQQELSKNGPAIATYIPLSDTILIITYAAPASSYAAGISSYNQIIDSVKVTE